MNNKITERGNQFLEIKKKKKIFVERSTWKKIFKNKRAFVKYGTKFGQIRNVSTVEEIRKFVLKIMQWLEGGMKSTKKCAWLAFLSGTVHVSYFTKTEREPKTVQTTLKALKWIGIDFFYINLLHSLWQGKIL